jgi:hypothetical protein
MIAVLLLLAATPDTVPTVPACPAGYHIDREFRRGGSRLVCHADEHRHPHPRLNCSMEPLQR